MIQELRTKFIDLYSVTPRMFRSPGRINIIGEHTDYNDGFVLPAAIDKEIVFDVAPNNTGTFRFYAADLNDFSEFPDIPQTDKKWANYLLGVVAQMQKKGFHVPSVDVVFGGNVPLGAGLSSSATLECGFAYALNAIFDFGFSTIELVKMSQLTEHEFVGLRCGIMDQFAVMFGKKDSVVRLDCRSLEYEYFPFDPQGYKLVLINSMVKHSLGNEYNERRESCEKAVALMNREFGGVETLRDANYQMLETVKDGLTGDDYLRAKYVLDEKERVMAVCEALEAADYDTVGKKMYETHWGLSREYTVSCPELDFLVNTAQECGVTGSRVMGGGFGGCTINLVRDTIYEKFVSRAKREYARKYGIVPEIYDVTIGDGSRKLQ